MLEGLLKEQIRGDPVIADMLAKYKSRPAFFYQKSPEDTASGWSKPCYPRADYNIDMRYDPERKASGALTINAWCTSESEFQPEDIERRLVALISGTFYTPPGGATISAIWSSSAAFDFEGNTSDGDNTAPEVFGVTIMFDLLEFPEQITTTPDPVQALNIWSKDLFPGATIIAHDQMPEVWKPSDMNPAIYWRFDGASADDRQSYAVDWYIGTFAAHVVADSVTERNRWIKALVETIQLEGEILLADRSPMFAQRIAIRHDADPLRVGQLLLTGKYGVLAQQRRERAENLLSGPFGTFGAIAGNGAGTSSDGSDGGGDTPGSPSSRLNDFSGNPLNRAVFPTLGNMEVSAHGKE